MYEDKHLDIIINKYIFMCTYLQMTISTRVAKLSRVVCNNNHMTHLMLKYKNPIR